MDWIAGVLVVLVVVVIGAAVLLTPRNRRNRTLEESRDVAPSAEADARAAASYGSRNADIGGSGGV